MIDLVKTVLIYVLTVSMLATAGLYINERQSAGQSEEISEEKRRIFESGGTAFSKIKDVSINPVQITVTAGYDSVTAIYNDKLIAEIYGDFIYSIRGIFNRNSECKRLEKEEGKELWGKCVSSENSIYIKYPGNYIYPVIYMFLDETWDIKNSADAFSNELAMVHEFFILEEENVYGVAKDIYGNVSVFRPESETGNILRSHINTVNLSAYNNNAGVISCEFLKNEDINTKTAINSNNIKNLKFPEHFHLFYNYNTYSSVLKFTNPVLDDGGKIDTERNFIKDFFRLCNFNAESSRQYTDKSGVTFIDGKNNIKFNNNGQIIYSYKPADINDAGGIPLVKFLGYGSGYYTFYEKIKASEVFAGSLAGEITGGECNIYLTDIMSNGKGDLTVVFSYYYGGIKIKVNGCSDGIIVVINEKSITEVKINSVYVSSSDMVKNRNPILELSGIDNEIDNEIARAIQSHEDTENTEDLEEMKKAGKYGFMYDKIQDKFIVNKFELIYSIDYVNKDSVKAGWEIK